MENLEKQFHQLTHNAMLSVNRQFDDAVIWEWIITNFEPKDSNKVDAVVSGKFADAWQKCPKCDGQGIVSKPPYVAGDVHEWSSTSAVHTCNVCNGAKIIKR